MLLPVAGLKAIDEYSLQGIGDVWMESAGLCNVMTGGTM